MLAEMAAGSGPHVVNVAETCVGTRALGPGIRSVVWVQGCPLHCRGCVAPDWIPQRQARLVPRGPGRRTARRRPGVGPDALRRRAHAAGHAAGRDGPGRSRQRDVSVICYSGFTLSELRERPPAPGVARAARSGRRPHRRPVRGSGQRRPGTAWQLQPGRAPSHRPVNGGRRDALHGGPRTAEIRVRDRSVLLVGVPPPGLARDIDLAARRVRRMTGAGLPEAGAGHGPGGEAMSGKRRITVDEAQWNALHTAGPPAQGPPGQRPEAGRRSAASDAG